MITDKRLRMIVNIGCADHDALGHEHVDMARELLSLRERVQQLQADLGEIRPHHEELVKDYSDACEHLTHLEAQLAEAKSGWDSCIADLRKADALEKHHGSE